MTILRAQVESNERGLCCCGQRATSELLYAKDMDQRQDAVMDMVIFRMIFFELLVFFTFTLLTLHFAY